MPAPRARTPGTGTRPRPGSCTPDRSAGCSGCRRCRWAGPGGDSSKRTPSPPPLARSGWAPGRGLRRRCASAALHLDGLDDDVVHGLVVAAGRHLGDGVDDIAAALVGHLTEDGVFAVQVRRGADGDEELRAVGAWARVRHGEQVRPVEGQLGVELVAELVAGATEALPERVAALDHEAVDDAVEYRPVV